MDIWGISGIARETKRPRFVLIGNERQPDRWHKRLGDETTPFRPHWKSSYHAVTRASSTRQQYGCMTLPLPVARWKARVTSNELPRIRFHGFGLGVLDFGPDADAFTCQR